MDFRVVRNDIANMDVDAIVCPSNPKLKEGSGTSAAIFGGAGRTRLAKACSAKLSGITPTGTAGGRMPLIKRKAKVPVGNSVVTSAYELPAKIIIHTVVPRWHGGRHDEYEQLSEAYVSALVVADRTGCTSLALPLLASGNMGFDLDVAIEVAVKSVEAFEPTNQLSDVLVVTYSADATQKMRDLGCPVKEIVDERYVQENDESYKLPIVRVAASAKDAAHDFIDQAIRIADGLIDDEAVKDVVKKVAVEVIVNYVKKKYPSLGDPLKKAVSGIR